MLIACPNCRDLVSVDANDLGHTTKIVVTGEVGKLLGADVTVVSRHLVGKCKAPEDD